MDEEPLALGVGSLPPPHSLSPLTALHKFVLLLALRQTWVFPCLPPPVCAPAGCSPPPFPTPTPNGIFLCR